MPQERTRRVTVKVTTKDGQDKNVVPTFIEVDRGAGHVRVGGQDMVCNMDEQTFDLLPGQRLIIEGFTPEAIAYDRDQAAAYRPDQQRAEGKIDAPKAQPQQGSPRLEELMAKQNAAGHQQTSASGAKPSETQDSRLKSSPGTTTTPAMQSTPSANTGAQASKPQGAQTADAAALKAKQEADAKAAAEKAKAQGQQGGQNK